MAIFPSFGNLKGGRRGELWAVYLFIVSLGKFIFSLGDETDIRAIPSPTLYTPSQRYPCTVCAAAANGRCCGHKNHILSNGRAAHGSICALVMEPHPCECSSTWCAVPYWPHYCPIYAPWGHLDSYRQLYWRIVGCRCHSESDHHDSCIRCVHRLCRRAGHYESPSLSTRAARVAPNKRASEFDWLFPHSLLPRE